MSESNLSYTLCAKELSPPALGESRFVVAPVKDEIASLKSDHADDKFLSNGTDDVNLDMGDGSDEDIDKYGSDGDVYEYKVGKRICESQCAQSDMPRVELFTAISDAGSLFGSSVWLSTPSRLNASSELFKSQRLDTDVTPTSMEYLDTIMENAEYVDTLQGKLPLAEAARLIAQDRSKHKQLFDSSHAKTARIECYKRLLGISIAFLCLFGSSNALRYVQSSLPGQDPAVALVTFGCLRWLPWVGALLASPFISKISLKWTIFVGAISFLPYPVANYYPVPYLMIPCALLNGIGVGLLWNAQGVFVVNLSAKYAFISKTPLMDVIGKFNGVVQTFYQFSHLVGNLVTSLALGAQVRSLFSPSDSENHTRYERGDIDSFNYSAFGRNITCGLVYSPVAEEEQTAPNVVSGQYQLLFALFTAVSLLGVIICGVLKQFKIQKTTGYDSIALNMKRLRRTFVNPQLLLLFPYIIYLGLSGTLVLANYMKAYVTCAYGVSYIGYILMTGACFSVAGAFISGRIVYKTGRILLFFIGNLSEVVCMLSIVCSMMDKTYRHRITTGLGVVLFLSV